MTHDLETRDNPRQDADLDAGLSFSELVDQYPPETPFDLLMKKHYRPRHAEDAEKLRLIGATREELRRWFGVHEVFLDIWEQEYPEFAKVLQVEPVTKLRVVEDFGIINWLKDYRFGNLDI
jgi:hypothetical protein